MNKKYWEGAPPEKCDLCGRALNFYFVDGKLKRGTRGVFCVQCYSNNGIGFGKGRGQAYERQPNEKWLKIGG